MGNEQYSSIRAVQPKFHTCSALRVAIALYITIGPVPLALLPGSSRRFYFVIVGAVKPVLREWLHCPSHYLMFKITNKAN